MIQALKFKWTYRLCDWQHQWC